MHQASGKSETLYLGSTIVEFFNDVCSNEISEDYTEK